MAKTHGDSGTKLYKCWENMKMRCLNPKSSSYSHYGGKGISVCKDWKENYINFRKWALLNGYEIGLSIDRIDNDGNYCPENCRWVTLKIQCNNRTSNQVISYLGETLTAAQWCKKLSINAKAVYGRLERGWNPVRAISVPIRNAVVS